MLKKILIGVALGILPSLVFAESNIRPEIPRNDVVVTTDLATVNGTTGAVMITSSPIVIRWIYISSPGVNSTLQIYDTRSSTSHAKAIKPLPAITFGSVSNAEVNLSSFIVGDNALYNPILSAVPSIIKWIAVSSPGINARLEIYNTATATTGATLATSVFNENSYGYWDNLNIPCSLGIGWYNHTPEPTGVVGAVSIGYTTVVSKANTNEYGQKYIDNLNVHLSSGAAWYQKGTVPASVTMGFNWK